MKDAIQVVTAALKQMPLMALQRAKKDCTDNPRNILLTGMIFDTDRYGPMVAGLPAEVLDMVPANTTLLGGSWLRATYNECYGTVNFRSNPYLDGVDGSYAHCLESLELSEVILIIDNLIEEKQSHEPTKGHSDNNGRLISNAFTRIG